MSSKNKAWVDMLRDRIIPNMQASSDLRQRFSSEIVALEIIADLLEELPPSNPAPLTLEELRGMDGEPVWIVSQSESMVCIVVVDSPGDSRCVHPARWGSQYFSFRNYGKTWLAYTHKPKDREGEGK